MNWKTFMVMLIQHVPAEHINTLLEAISNEISKNGQCPFCQCDEVPVDSHGNEIIDSNVVEAVEWREEHDDDCPVALLEAAAKGGNF